METMTYTTELTTTSCGECAAPFALPASIHRKCKNDGRMMWCPTCGSSLTYSKTQNEVLQLALDAARRRVADQERQLEAVERSRAAMRGQVTKIKNRVARGICPCCNRSFENLTRHMATKHPDYANSDPAGSGNTDGE